MTLHYKINKPPALIFDYLTDMQKFVAVHPVIYKTEQIEKNRYLVFETLKFGFIPYSLSSIKKRSAHQEIPINPVKT